ncbi:hypothetical protein EES44_25600 [Streptomyces sp. ADI96-15]|nr:hypothetical protein EES44_25600 [Streptomyces sp. ADI96-15]
MEAEAIVAGTVGGEGVWADDRVAQVLERLVSDLVLDSTYREQHLSLTAGVNCPSKLRRELPSKLVRMSGSGLQGRLYEFAPPYSAEAGEQAFADSRINASLVGELTGIGRQLFEAATFDRRPSARGAARTAARTGYELGRALRAAGRPQEADALVAAALESARRRGSATDEVRALRELAELADALGEAGRAEEHRAEAGRIVALRGGLPTPHTS